MSKIPAAAPAAPGAEERHRLTEDVLRFIEAGVDSEVPDSVFNDYSLRMFAFHYEVNAIFREFCDAKKVRPGDVKRWQDLPMVHTYASQTPPVPPFPPEQSALSSLPAATTPL